MSIVVVGSGGLANDLWMYLAPDLNEKIILKGVLTDNFEDYQDSLFEQEYLGKIKDYKIEEDDQFIVAIGENPGRAEVINYLKSLGAKFFTFIHPSVILHPSSKIEEGSIIGPFCSIGAKAGVGEHTFLNKYCNIGHGARIGRNCIMSPYSMVGGNACISNNVTIYTRSTIAPNCKIAAHSKIAAHTFVRKNVSRSMLVSDSPKQVRKEISGEI